MSSLLKNVGTIGGLTMVSRIFGFARDMLLSRILGAGGVADAWQLAFQLPNIFRRLFAEGAFAAAFVPLFNQRMTKEGDHSEARAFADALNHVQAAVMKASPHILLRIEPQDVQVVQAQEAVRKEAFLFFFLRRERRTYSVELDVTVNVTAINLDQVDFVTQR